MLNEIRTAKKVIGLKQSLKAVKEGQAKKAFIAQDADSFVRIPFEEECKKQGIPVEFCETCAELGRVCEIDVSAAVAVILG